MRLIIVTGASKGLGNALVRQFAKGERASKVVGVSRTECDLSESNYKHYIADLSDQSAINDFLCFVAESPSIESITFVNNAGVITPIGQVRNLNIVDIIYSININFIAPIFITNGLSKLVDKLKVVNISSGAAEQPISGWTSYCSSKAGLKMFYQVMEKGNEIDLLNIDPGVMNTEMQEKIRDTDIDVFPDVDNFIAFKENDLLKSPWEVAKNIIHQMRTEKFI